MAVSVWVEKGVREAGEEGERGEDNRGGRRPKRLHVYFLHTRLSAIVLSGYRMPPRYDVAAHTLYPLRVLVLRTKFVSPDGVTYLLRKFT